MGEPRLFPPSSAEILAGILKMHRLPSYYDKEILKYLNGELSEKRLVCCHTGCDICEDNIYNAVLEAKRVLGKEPFE